jgi:hypothetical protein
MATMTHSIESSSQVRHHFWTTALLATSCWMIGGAAVLAAHVALDSASPVAGAVAAIAAIGAAAYGYMRMFASGRGVTHALSVGAAWLAMSMAAEIMMASHLGHGWFTLIGSPTHPLLRNVYLFVWIFTPALFARGEEETAD